mgnify:FL=1
MSKVSEYLEPHIYFPNEFPPPEELIEVYSDCCGSRIILNDICSKCKEHCNQTNEEE